MDTSLSGIFCAIITLAVQSARLPLARKLQRRSGDRRRMSMQLSGIATITRCMQLTWPPSFIVMGMFVWPLIEYP
jgi:hypothetical protein